MFERRQRALVIGGSIGGLMVERLLARAGWQVDVFERVSGSQTSRGAGIVTHPELFAALRQAGIGVGREVGITVERRVVLDKRGRVSHETAAPQVTTSWAMVYQLLRDRIDEARLFGGREFIRFEQDEDGVTATFADGSSERGDILIGADGFRSTVRQQLFPDIALLYAGYVTWRGLVPRERLSARTQATLFDHFGFSLPPAEQMLGYPIKPAEGPSPAYNFVWYRPADENALRRFLTDRNGTLHELSVPPPLVEPSLVAAMREDAAGVLAPQFADIVSATEQPFLQPIYDLEVPQQAIGRVALIGDAAFVVRPHVGAGVTKAFDDALALARHLERTPAAAALAAFSAERQPEGARIVARARELGAYMQAQCNSEAERRNAELFREPNAVMLQTASLEFLRQFRTEGATLSRRPAAV